MKRNHKFRVFASLFYFILSCVAAEATTVRAINISGPEAGSQLETKQGINKNNTHYILKLNAFNNKNHALQFQSKMASYTKDTVHLVYYPSAPVPYVVFIGPIDNARHVVKVSRDLLARQTISSAANVSYVVFFKPSEVPAKIIPETGAEVVAKDTTQTRGYLSTAINYLLQYKVPVAKTRHRFNRFSRFSTNKLFFRKDKTQQPVTDEVNNYIFPELGTTPPTFNRVSRFSKKKLFFKKRDTQQSVATDSNAL